MSTTLSGSPGISSAQLLQTLDDNALARILPDGAITLIQLLRPEALLGPSRQETVGKLFSLELALDDRTRRAELLGALSNTKALELEERVGADLMELCETETLNSSQRRCVMGFFGISTGPERTVSQLMTDSNIAASHGLFSHQKRAAAAIERFLYVENGRAMLHLPTGVGKTRTAMSIVASHLRNKEHALVVWLANSRELLEQAATEFETTWSAAGDRPVTCHRFWSNHDPPANDLRDGIIIAGLAKLNSFGRVRERLWSLGDRASLVVFDEAHQAVATTYEDLVSAIATRNPRTGLLGLSATPGRTWNDPAVDEAVSNLFYGNKVTLDFGDDNPIERLTREEYLAEANFQLLNVIPGVILSERDMADLSHSLDIPESVAEVLGADEQRNLRILQRLFELYEHHHRILVFAASVNNSRLLASICRAAGLNADSLTGVTDSTQRRHVIERFKRADGKRRILINYGILTAGFDAPAASAALIARPTKSLVLYSQMVGRVIRGPKAGGTKSCEIVTVVDTTLPGFDGVAQAFMNWEDIWN